MESFTAEPQSLKLPLAPTNPIIVRKEHNRPQPRLDRDAGGGMSVVVGRVRRDPALGGIKYAVLGHNTIRGAAGCTILIGEYLKAKKYV
jgi:aspartate-semialdehyde dehydrogenase